MFLLLSLPSPFLGFGADQLLIFNTRHAIHATFRPLSTDQPIRAIKNGKCCTPFELYLARFFLSFSLHRSESENSFAHRRQTDKASVLMQRPSYLTETVLLLTNKIAMNIIVLCFKDSPRKSFRRRPTDRHSSTAPPRFPRALSHCRSPPNTDRRSARTFVRTKGDQPTFLFPSSERTANSDLRKFLAASTASIISLLGLARGTVMLGGSAVKFKPFPHLYVQLLDKTSYE